MKLFLVSRKDSVGYDEHDSFVCNAKSAKDAKDMMPDGSPFNELPFSTWTNKKENIDVKYLGVSKVGSKRGVICASFNAG